MTKRQISILLFLGLMLIFTGMDIRSSSQPFIWTLGVSAGYATWLILSKRAGDKERLAQLENQAAILDRLAEGDFNVENTVFVTEPDEILVYHLAGVALTEFKSTGSSFAGGFGGLSVGVSDGVRVGAGIGGGKSVRSPEVSQILDVGELTVTNQRLVFTGANLVRVFDLNKVVNMEAGPNGLTVSVSVSNRDKTSGFQSANLGDLTPGMAVSLATAWHEGGKEAAVDSAKDMATRLREAVAAELAEKK